jgi:hypothetical protein
VHQATRQLCLHRNSRDSLKPSTPGSNLRKSSSFVLLAKRAGSYFEGGPFQFRRSFAGSKDLEGRVRHRYRMSRNRVSRGLVLRSWRMPTEHILALLIAERDKLNVAIEALQGPTKRRGRPPKNPFGTATATASPAPRRGMSAAKRKAQSVRMKAFWAKRRKSAGK